MGPFPCLPPVVLLSISSLLFLSSFLLSSVHALPPNWILREPVAHAIRSLEEFNITSDSRDSVQLNSISVSTNNSAADNTSAGAFGLGPVSGKVNYTGHQNVTIGILLSSDNIGGSTQAVFSAIKLASKEINASPLLLRSNYLRVLYANASSDFFQAQAAALQLMKEDPLVVIGPLYSRQAKKACDLATVTQIPVVSYGATDPALSSQSQYPYFVRMIHSDEQLMQAVAAGVAANGWKQIVTIYSDDDYGRNGILKLTSYLTQRQNNQVYIVSRVPVDPQGSAADIKSALDGANLLIASVYVVHVSEPLVIPLFTQANATGMLSSGYVWILTESATNILKSFSPSDPILKPLQGVIGITVSIQSSLQLGVFGRKWKSLDPKEYPGAGNDRINIFALFAYDTMWLAARALDLWLKANTSITSFAFSPQNPRLLPGQGGTVDFADLKISQNGPNILAYLLNTTFNSTTGQISIDPLTHSLNTQSFDIQNLAPGPNGTSVFNTIANFNPQRTPKIARYNQSVYWLGGLTKTPTGWLSNSSSQLVVGVAINTLPPQVVSYNPAANDTLSMFSGFAVDVFRAAVANLSYPLNYRLQAVNTDNYDDLLQQVADTVIDAAIGGITITNTRNLLVDFTSPFQEAPLALVTLRSSAAPAVQPDPFKFFQPFALSMWGLLLALFFVTAFFYWLFENRVNPDMEGNWIQQSVSSLWFSFSTMVYQHGPVLSIPGRLLISFWVLVILVLTSSYTASFTSMLTAAQLQPSVSDLSSVINNNNKVGYTYPYIRSFLIDSGVQPSNLVAVTANTSVSKLASKEVDIIIDDKPNQDLVVTSNCSFVQLTTTVGSFYWAFAVQKNSYLGPDLSSALSAIAADGRLEKIHSKWFPSNSTCKKLADFSSSVVTPRLGLDNFWGLFLVHGVVVAVALLLHVVISILFYLRNREEIKMRVAAPASGPYVVGAAVPNDNGTVPSPGATADDPGYDPNQDIQQEGSGPTQEGGTAGAGKKKFMRLKSLQVALTEGTQWASAHHRSTKGPNN